MYLKANHKRNFIVFKILTFVLLVLFNLSNASRWDYMKLLPLILLTILYNLFIMKRDDKKILNIESIKLKFWGNFILISVILWFLGGMKNLSFHIYFSFIVITSIIFINRLQGIIFAIISSIFFSILFFRETVEFTYYTTFLYIIISSVFFGNFARFYYKKSHVLDRKVKEFEALYKISKIIDAFPSTEIILDNIAEIIAKTLDIDECLIMLYDGEKDILSARARYGKIGSKMGKITFRRGEGVSGKVLVTKERVISSDLLKDRHILNAFKYDFGIKSCAIIPLIYENEGIGVIAVYSKEKYEFTDDNINLLDIIASRIVKVLENNKLYKEVKIRSITDGLTKLYNHRYFYDVLKIEMDRAAMYDKKLFLLMIDIDKFKSFNDTYGHIVGDKVLKEISKIIKDNIRSNDIAARYGGEEFAIILPNSDWEIAHKVAQRIKDKVKDVKDKISELANKDVKITISIGMACYPNCAKNIRSLIEKADLRMYHGKEKGGDNVVFENKV